MKGYITGLVLRMTECLLPFSVYNLKSLSCKYVKMRVHTMVLQVYPSLRRTPRDDSCIITTTITTTNAITTTSKYTF